MNQILPHDGWKKRRGGGVKRKTERERNEVGRGKLIIDNCIE